MVELQTKSQIAAIMAQASGVIVSWLLMWLCCFFDKFHSTQDAVNQVKQKRHLCFLFGALC